MTIEIYTCGKTLGKSGSGFAVILRSISNIWKRSFAYGKMSANQAEIEAVKFGLLSVSKSYTNEQIQLFTKNKYIKDMLEKEKGIYKMVPKANLESINLMRTLFDNFKNITLESDGQLCEECSELCATAIKEGIEINDKR